MRNLIITCVVLGAAIGCEPVAPNKSSVPIDRAPDTTSSVPPARDNTEVNKRDQNAPDKKTPIDQDENKRDIQITADIRKAVLAIDGMSVNARNSKIITSNGKVTLRGPVASAEEKEKVEKAARDVAGADNVTSELEVQP